MSAGSSFFVDSNVLLYYVDPMEPAKRERATEWLEALWTSGLGRLSWQVLHEFYWNAVKKMGLSPANGREIVEDLSQWRLVDTTLGLVSQAWDWMDSAHLTYWDALILAAAQRSGARYLLSEDFQANRHYGEIQVLSPFDYAPVDFNLT